MIYTVTLNPAVDRELTVPAIEFDTVLRANDWRVDFGGKGFNVSRMLMALGSPSIALGFAGGRAGELLRDGLASLGIQTDFIWVEGETRTNVSIVDEGNGRYVKVNEPGPTIAAADQEKLLAQVRQLAQPGDWWVLAGSLPPGVPPTMYADIISILHQANAKAILDTSGAALEHGCAARPFLAKPNDAEASKLTGLPVKNRVQIAVAAQTIQATGVSNVVISLGKDGAMLANGQQTVVATSPTIEEQNPIGAGDSMVGGLVWGLSHNQDVSESLRWGIACGAATASMKGTAVGNKAVVKSLHSKVTLDKLETKASKFS
ncbi:MAG: 1-phosphofructokinase [Chloroflexi bacterium]|nr:MAG: 1-phosphofructokinase [Chloroflexota bacterium]